MPGLPPKMLPGTRFQKTKTELGEHPYTVGPVSALLDVHHNIVDAPNQRACRQTTAPHPALDSAVRTECAGMA